MSLNRDTSRDNGPDGEGSDNSSEHLRSLAEFIGLDKLLMETQGASHHRNMNGSSNALRAVVPPKCISQLHPWDYASYSQSTPPGHSWDCDTGHSGKRITNLVASLKALTLPEHAPRHHPQSYSQSIHLRVSCENNAETVRSPEVNTTDTCLNRSDEARVLPRRASFCGVIPSGGNIKDAVRWEGTLPPRCLDYTAGVSPKVFLGGLPWGITKQSLKYTLRHFQPVCVEWPEQEAVGGAGRSPSRFAPGFAYITFESQQCVLALLSASRREGNNMYYPVQGYKMRRKDVQVIPWCVSDASWVGCSVTRLEPKRTVFVGALHGMLSATALAKIMDDLFSGVVYVGLDMDKSKYPMGSGRVTFNNVHSYIHAVSTGFVEIITDKFTKKVQVLPYLEDSVCSVCNLKLGPYFCREPTCYRYFCRLCWTWQHQNEEHKPLMRNFKSQSSGTWGTRTTATLGTPIGMSGSLSEPVTGSHSEEPEVPPLWSNLQ